MLDGRAVKSELCTLYDLSQAYLDWVVDNRATATYGKQKHDLESFIGSVGKSMKPGSFKPYTAADLSNRGRRVLLIDADPQASSLAWSNCNCSIRSWSSEFQAIWAGLAVDRISSESRGISPLPRIRSRRCLAPVPWHHGAL
jgi:hypothetical protein